MTAWLGPDEWRAVQLSLKVAFWAVFCGLPLAVFVAYALVRWRFPGRGLLNGLIHLPLVLPPVVTGYLLLIAFGRSGSIGRLWQAWFDTPFTLFAFRWTGAALAAGIMAFPLMVRSVRLAIEAVDPRLEAAASTLGAPKPWVFLTVTLPLILPGILTAVILGFARAMGEFGATITFVSNIPGETQTLASAIHAFLQMPGGDAAAMRLTLVAVLIALLALMLSESLSRMVARRIAGT